MLILVSNRDFKFTWLH